MAVDPSIVTGRPAKSTGSSTGSSGTSGTSTASFTALDPKWWLSCYALGPRTTRVGILLLVVRAGIFFLLGIAGSAGLRRNDPALSPTATGPSSFVASTQQELLLGDPARTKFGFFSIIYSLSEDEKQHWRWLDAKKTCEQNNAILKEAGFPGLTVFATNESMRADWDVYKLVVLPQVFEGCPSDIPLCPKINFFKQKELWSEVASEAVFFLDADARIVSKTFISVAEQYLELPIDFAASPDVSFWENIGLRHEGPYNTGAYFMRLSAFHNADFERVLDMGLDRNRRASPSAPDPPPPQKKPMSQGEQTAFNTYLLETPAGKAVRKLNLPWKMHCRTRYVTNDCWLVHWWYEKEFESLPHTFEEARGLWEELTEGVTNRTANDF